MPITIRGQVGPQVVNDGAEQSLRQGRSAELVVQELHGRFYEQVYRGNVYGIGLNLTALTANTISTANTGTGTPILGVWNPLTSPVNLVILQVALGFVLNTLTAPVGPGPFVWQSSVNNAVITGGSAPTNRKTLQAAGSQAKAFAVSALTGLTNNVAFLEAADLPQASGQTAGTIAASTTSSQFAAGFNGVINYDGSLIVPPGGVLGLYNTTSTTTYSAAGRLMWEEVLL